MNSAKYSITKMEIKTERRTDLYLQNKIKFKLFMHHQYQDQVDHIHEIFSCTAASSNFNCYSAAKAKDMIDFPSSLQVFALTPDILVVRANRNRNKYLTVNIQMGKVFITNRLFVS